MASWDDVTKFEDLQELTPAQRREDFRSHVVLDTSTLSVAERERLAEMRARLDARAAEREARLRGQAS
jgi:hypothetical protein